MINKCHYPTHLSSGVTWGMLLRQDQDRPQAPTKEGIALSDSPIKDVFNIDSSYPGNS